MFNGGSLEISPATIKLPYVGILGASKIEKFDRGNHILTIVLGEAMRNRPPGRGHSPRARFCSSTRLLPATGTD